MFFCTQSATDVPSSILSQLGNRAQHAIRVFTPNDPDALKKTVNTYPRSDFYEIDKVLTSLGTAQVLVTVLNGKGIPTEVVATVLTSPRSFMGPLAIEAYHNVIRESMLGTKYAEAIDPEIAYGLLTKRINDKLTVEEEAGKAAEITTVQKKGDKPSLNR